MADTLLQNNTKSRRNIIIYLKNKGLWGYERKSYSQLANEYGTTSARISQIVPYVRSKFSKLTGKELFKDGVPMRYVHLLEGGDLDD